MLCSPNKNATIALAMLISLLLYLFIIYIILYILLYLLPIAWYGRLSCHIRFDSGIR